MAVAALKGAVVTRQAAVEEEENVGAALIAAERSTKRALAEVDRDSRRHHDLLPPLTLSGFTRTVLPRSPRSLRDPRATVAGACPHTA